MGLLNAPVGRDMYELQVDGSLGKLRSWLVYGESNICPTDYDR